MERVTYEKFEGLGLAVGSGSEVEQHLPHGRGSPPPHLFTPCTGGAEGHLDVTWGDDLSLLSGNHTCPALTDLCVVPFFQGLGPRLR